MTPGMTPWFPAVCECGHRYDLAVESCPRALDDGVPHSEEVRESARHWVTRKIERLSRQR